jgi:hypothetical protein
MINAWEIIGTIGGLMLAILTHLCIFIWWASKLTTTVQFLTSSIEDIKKEESKYFTRSEHLDWVKHSDEIHGRQDKDISDLQREFNECAIIHSIDRRKRD